MLCCHISGQTNLPTPPPHPRHPIRMAARLILNADDFGLTHGVNRAIRELHQAGALTSATLMATGAAFDDAVAIAHAHPTLGVGSTSSSPTASPSPAPRRSPPCSAPTAKRFRPSLLDFLQALLRGKISETEIEREALAQLHKLQRAGIPVTHLDTHKHTHLFPQVTRPLLRIAETNAIRAIRNPFEQPWSLSPRPRQPPPPPTGPAARRPAHPLRAPPPDPHRLGPHHRRHHRRLRHRRSQPRHPAPALAQHARRPLGARLPPRLQRRRPRPRPHPPPHPARDRAPRPARRAAQKIALPNPPQLIHYGNLD